MHQFSENRPELSGFNDYFRDVLGPRLAALEGRRVAASGRSKRYALLAGLGTLVLGGVGVSLANARLGWDMPFFVVIIVAFMAAVFAAVLPSEGVRKEIKAVLAGGVFDHIGWTFSPKAERVDLGPWKALGLLPQKHGAAKFEDAVTGTAQGVAVRAVDADIKPFSDEGGDTGYQGLLIELQLPRAFDGRTVVLPDRGRGNADALKLDGGTLKRVGFADPTFEQAFEAYSNDQVGARVLLDPVFMEQLVAMRDAGTAGGASHESAPSGGEGLKAALQAGAMGLVHRRSVRFGVDGDRMYIALAGALMFDFIASNVAADDPRNVSVVLRQVAAMLDVIDAVAARPTGRA